MECKTSKIFFPLMFILAGCKSDSPIHPGTESLLNQSLRPFYHGVASGDPTSDRVIIWTRVTPDKFQPTAVGWRVALDSSFQNTVQAGAITALPEHDFTVKIDVTGLKSDTRYYYRFVKENLHSAIGRTRTLPALGTRPVNLAVIGSSDYEKGYFNAYQLISNRDDLDAIVQLGSYLSTEATNDAAITSRRHLPGTALATLDDYRIRYAQYRLDPQLSAAHKKHTFIHAWNDELPQTESEDGPPAARQAYFEWLPVRETGDERMFRNIRFGTLADLNLLDQRMIETSPQVAFPPANKAVLGGRQLSWLTTQLVSSQSQWKLVSFKGLFCRPRDHGVPTSPYWSDATEQKLLADSITVHQVKNVVFLSADAGGSWTFDVNSLSSFDKLNKNQARLAVEFTAPDVTRQTEDALTGHQKNLEAALLSNKENSQLKYVNLRDPGYLLLQLEYERLRASWFYVDSTDPIQAVETMGMQFELTQKGNLSAREPTLTRVRK